MLLSLYISLFVQDMSLFVDATNSELRLGYSVNLPHDV